MKKNEIERTTRHEPEVYVKVKFIMNSTVCGQPDPQCKQWGESTSEQTVDVMRENHQHRGRIHVITRPVVSNVRNSLSGVFGACSSSQNN